MCEENPEPTPGEPDNPTTPTEGATPATWLRPSILGLAVLLILLGLFWRCS